MGRSIVAMLAVALLLPGLAAGEDPQEKGHKLFLRYCSACHGDSGRGDGVVSGLMQPPPADLTHIAARAGGTFDLAAVTRTIDGRDTPRAHGKSDMPVWGEILSTNAEGVPIDGADAQKKVELIARYLETIQVK